MTGRETDHALVRHIVMHNAFADDCPLPDTAGVLNEAAEIPQDVWDELLGRVAFPGKPRLVVTLVNPDTGHPVRCPEWFMRLRGM